MPRPRIGAVSYLNTKPLVFGLDSLADECTLSYDLPSRLSDQLAACELDVALIPSIEAAIDSQYTIVSDACIGCRGPVWSVKLLSHVAPEQIQSISLDEGSRTSAALTKILLAEKFNVQPQFQQLGIDQNWKKVSTDAVLLIGDRAMNPDTAPFEHAWDLGEVWNQWTGMPFVFAMWTSKNSEHLDRLDWLLTTSRDQGAKNVDSIAEKNHYRYDLSLEQCQKYLGQHLQFFLGSEEKAALEHFYELAAKNDLIPQGTKLNFHECQATQ